ncbi:unnamed protein product, partial [Iphiclides podalirius]
MSARALYPWMSRGRDGRGAKSRTATHSINIPGVRPFPRGRDAALAARSSRTERAGDYRKRSRASPSIRYGRATESGHAPNATLSRSG